jgi:hypothetical protein
VSPVGAGALVIPRFYRLPLWLLCVFVALGLEVLRLSGRYLVPLGVAFAGASLLRAAPLLAVEHGPGIEYWMKNALTQLPPGAIALSEGDHRVFALSYAQKVMHLRPDVTVLRYSVLDQPEERRRTEEALGFDPVGLSAEELARVLLSGQRPVFLTLGVATELMHKVPMVPVVPWFRLLGQGESPPSLGQLTADNQRAFASFLRGPVVTDARPTWTTLTFLDYQEAWVWLARRWQAQNDDARVLACLSELEPLAPWLAETAMHNLVRSLTGPKF